MASDNELHPVWRNVDRAVGQLLMMGWEDDRVTPSIRSLIRDHHVGSIILVAKNLKSPDETAKLVQELQMIAHDAGHPVPLLIAMDQENGGVNSLYDEEYICQYPSAMGMAATGSLDLTFDVAKATAMEVSAVGVNMMLGPVLDVLNNAQFQPLGVRATGDDPLQASQYGIASMNGYKTAGLAACGKHFPSYGNLNFLGSSLDMPTITETIEQLSLSALVPFSNAIKSGIDAIMVGGCSMTNTAMNVMHACLSEQIVDDLLRRDLEFDGVIISECIEMDAISLSTGVRGGTLMALEAGCDLVLLCRSFSVQQDAISGLKTGIEDHMLSLDRIHASLNRVLRVKSRCTSWERALHPPGLKYLMELHPLHAALSNKAYNNSITVIRDGQHLLPLPNTLLPNDELLLLTPLLKPLPASAATKFLAAGKQSSAEPDRWMDRASIMSGEGVFHELGRSLARQRDGKLLHTSYTANGVRPIHEALIERASAIIIVTADATRNLYQTSFTKHVAMMCSMFTLAGKKKSIIAVAVSSPYDFIRDTSIGTYVCTYDFTETALAALVRVLFGEVSPQGSLPGSLRKIKNPRKFRKSRQNWFVEKWSDGDSSNLDLLISKVCKTASPGGTESPLTGATAQSFLLFDPNIEEQHFVVRNSSTNCLYGFCSTYIYANIGYIGAIFVDPAKRSLSIGHSLYQRATRHFHTRKDITILHVGISVPNIFPGIPRSDTAETAHLRRWLTDSDWPTESSTPIYSCVIRDLQNWTPAQDLVKSIQCLNIDFDLVHGLEHFESIAAHVNFNSSWETFSLYKFALSDAMACGVVRAKCRLDGSLIGTIILCRHGTRLAIPIPYLIHPDCYVGGVLSPVIAPSAKDPQLLLQGLLLLGIRQNKAHGANISYLNLINSNGLEAATPLGIEILYSFEELSLRIKR